MIKSVHGIIHFCFAANSKVSNAVDQRKISYCTKITDNLQESSQMLEETLFDYFSKFMASGQYMIFLSFDERITFFKVNF